MERIGIFGGTFDPIHYGHLILADQARYEANLSQVVFIPARTSPFKLHRETAEGERRYEMVRLAIEGNPFFVLSDMELKNKKVSYTIHTLRHCRKEFGEGCEICFITGTDAFLGVEQWNESEELLRDYSFVVGSRPGYREEALDAQIVRLRAERHSKIYKVHTTEVDISSTNIKEKIREGRPIRYHLPDSVAAYIRQNELYQSDEAGEGNL